MVAITFVVATFVISCKGKLQQVKDMDLSQLPVQRVVDMFAIQSENSEIKMEMEAPLMERYEDNTNNTSFELFPEGFIVKGYNKDGELETTITAKNARHTVYKGDGKGEKWEAYNDVVIKNYIKQETMETDTLYWDREQKKIFTHRYVKLYSPQGLMQGIGMESDEMARNATLFNPFESYGYVRDDNN